MYKIVNVLISRLWIYQKMHWRDCHRSRFFSQNHHQKSQSETERDVIVIMVHTFFISFPSLGCDNYYNGAIPPCLLRPWLPPYSYSTTEADNGEYRRRRRSGERIWRTIA